MAVDRLSEPARDDTPATRGDQANRIDQPDRTSAAKAASHDAPRTESRSRRQYLTEIRSGPMVRSDTPAQHDRAASPSNDKPAETAPRDRGSHDREHDNRSDRNGHETHREHPRSPDIQARTDHPANNGHAPDPEQVAVPDGSGDRSSELVQDKNRPAADPASVDAPALDNRTSEPEPPERGDNWPSGEDLGRWHSMYQEFRDEQADAVDGWERGTNAVGDKPDRSPGDISDLPPAGEELLTAEGGRQSRLEKLRRETEGPEIFDGLHDTLEKNASLAHDVFERPTPTGSHAGVPSGQPEISAPPTQGTDAGQIAVAGFVMGVLGVETVRWISHKVSVWKGRQHASDR